MPIGYMENEDVFPLHQCEMNCLLFIRTLFRRHRVYVFVGDPTIVIYGSHQSIGRSGVGGTTRKKQERGHTCNLFQTDSGNYRPSI